MYYVNIFPRLEMSDPGELEKLMSVDQYEDFLKTLDD